TFVCQNASLETSRPPIFGAATRAHPKTRWRCAAADRAWRSSRADPTRPTSPHGVATPPPIHAANWSADGAARSRRRPRSPRARNEIAVFGSDQPLVLVMTQRSHWIYFRRASRRRITSAERDKGQKRRHYANGQRVELADVCQRDGQQAGNHCSACQTNGY